MALEKSIKIASTLFEEKETFSTIEEHLAEHTGSCIADEIHKDT